MSLHYDSIEQLPEHLRKQAKEKLGIANLPAPVTSGMNDDEAYQLLVRGEKPKQNKYHVAAREDRTYRGVVYDSKREMLYYINTLEPQLLSGELDYVLPHVCFPLGAGVKYECDFLTLKDRTDHENGADRLAAWELTVIEVKMWRKATAKHPASFFFTPDAKIKMKLFREQYKQLKLEIVK